MNKVVNFLCRLCINYIKNFVVEISFTKRQNFKKTKKVLVPEITLFIYLFFLKINFLEKKNLMIFHQIRYQILIGEENLIILIYNTNHFL